MLTIKEEMKSSYKIKYGHRPSYPNTRRNFQNNEIYKMKEEQEGTRRYKTRLIIKGFQ